MCMSKALFAMKARRKGSNARTYDQLLDGRSSKGVSRPIVMKGAGSSGAGTRGIDYTGVSRSLLGG